MTPTSAHIQFGSDGVTDVDTALRLSGATHIQCYIYDHRPPILVLNDRRIRVSVTVPGADRVTAEDLKTGQRLADAAARYLADLERRIAAQSPAAEGEAA
jgi:hypothetical protein